MLELRFHPEADRDKLIQAADRYQAIWDADGDRIVEALTDVTQMRFGGSFFNALVHDAPTLGFPFRFAADLADPLKQATVVHELAHRLLSEHGLDGPVGNDRSDMASHVQLYVFLQDVWRRVWGDAFADDALQRESALRPLFRRAWQFVQTLDRKERQRRLSAIQADARRAGRR